jgi:hypothetical protein
VPFETDEVANRPSRPWWWALGWGATLTLAQVLFVCLAGDAPVARGLAFSGDGQHLAAIGEDWTVRVWDLDRAGTPSQIRFNYAEAVALVFRGDGKLMTTGSDFGRDIWDPDTETRETVERGQTGGIQHQAFSADASHMAFSGARGVYLIDLKNGNRSLVPISGSVRALAFRSDGARLAIANSDVVLVNLTEGTVRVLPITGSVLAFAHDELMIGSGSEVVVCDGASGEERRRLSGASGPITALAASAERPFLAAGSNDGSVVIWHVDGSLARTIDAHRGAVLDLAFSPDGRRLATLGEDRRVILWDAEAGTEIVRLREPDSPAWQAWLSGAYRRLCRWDVLWYDAIARHGYHSHLPDQNPETSNVAFFPGHVVLTRFVQMLAIPFAPVVASQLAAWGFWTYLLGMFRQFGLTARAALVGALAVFVHPAAFFLVNGYSESLFLFVLLGFLYWQRRPGLLAWLLAGCHGFAMSATRIVGLPLAGIPVARVVFERWRGGEGSPRRLFAAGALAAVTAAGGLLFFAYCAARFGQWDLYMATQRVGWDVVADYTAPLRWQLYIPTGDGMHVNRVSMLLLMVFFVLLLLREWRGDVEPGGETERACFYLAAAMLFYISVCGLYHKDLASMIRYSLTVYVMLVLAAANLAAHTRKVRRPSWLGIAGMAITVLATFALQIKLLRQFTEGRWVA